LLWTARSVLGAKSDLGFLQFGGRKRDFIDLLCSLRFLGRKRSGCAMIKLLVWIWVP
jgi:hypothetical protein